MLILNIKSGERAVFYSNGAKLGEMVVLKDGKKLTRIGFEFPESIKILRKELLEPITD
jgi:sRNA-binding carbon storage regulator CsrA